MTEEAVRQALGHYQQRTGQGIFPFPAGRGQGGLLSFSSPIKAGS